MVHLTRIYTRTGDDGTTALGNFERVTKTDSRLVAYADTHEANAAIGLAVALLGPSTGANAEVPQEHAVTSDVPEDAAETGPAEPRTHDLAAVLTRIQNDLFDVGADLSVPLNPEPTGPELRVHEDWISELEIYCDEFGADLPKLNSFILPGGTAVAAQLHIASTVVRRAERAAWAAIGEFGDSPNGGVNPLTAKYLNRLSDLLFIMARFANHEAATGPNGAALEASGDVLWQPAGGRLAPPRKRAR